MLKRHENKLPVSKDTGFKLMENTSEAYKTSNNCYKTFWYIQPGSIRNRWAHFLWVFHTNSKIVKEGAENKKREKESFSICSSHIGKFWKTPTHSNYMVLLHWEINYYSSIRGADKHLIFQKCLGFLYVFSLTKPSSLSGKKKKNLIDLLGSGIRADAILSTTKLNLCTCILLEVYLQSTEWRYLFSL